LEFQQPLLIPLTFFTIWFASHKSDLYINHCFYLLLLVTYILFLIPVSFSILQAITFTSTNFLFASFFNSGTLCFWGFNKVSVFRFRIYYMLLGMYWINDSFFLLLGDTITIWSDFFFCVSDKWYYLIFHWGIGVSLICLNHLRFNISLVSEYARITIIRSDFVEAAECSFWKITVILVYRLNNFFVETIVVFVFIELDWILSYPLEEAILWS
jgi:hypothetical protein